MRAGHQSSIGLFKPEASLLISTGFVAELIRVGWDVQKRDDKVKGRENKAKKEESNVPLPAG